MNADKKLKSNETLKNDNIHSGHRQRMREKYEAKGMDVLSDHEKLELLLYFTNKRKDTNPIAHALIKEFGNLQNVLNADREYLEKVPGVGKETALLINCVTELNNYMNRNKYKYEKKAVYLTNTAMAGEFCCDYFINRKKESLIAVLLNTQKKLLKVCTISEGTIDRTAMYSREIVELVIKNGASALILAHNHPDNGLNPSLEDINATTLVAHMNGGYYYA